MAVVLHVRSSCCWQNNEQSNSNKEQVKGVTPTGDRQFFFVMLVADGFFIYLSGCAGQCIFYLDTYICPLCACDLRRLQRGQAQ